MKAWLIAIFGLIIFIGLSIWSQHQIQKTALDFGREMKLIRQSVIDKNWDQTLERLHAVQKDWRRTKPFWAMILHHREIDSIDQALVRTISATKSRDYTQTRVELGSLEHFIEHVPERERFNLVNVL